VKEPRVLLFDLPTFPGGFPTLSLPTVGACLRDRFRVSIRDLNFHTVENYSALVANGGPASMIGLKVSAQNLDAAKAFTHASRMARPGTPVVWGGELPTLEPDLCSREADVVVRGRFEGIADAFGEDLAVGRLSSRYQANGGEPVPPPPAFDLIDENDAAQTLKYFGTPLETSLGCPEGCAFCLVHEMQPQTRTLPLSKIEEDLARVPREFVNVVDYNLGQNKEHLIQVAGAIGRSRAKGFSAELCLEALDDEQVLSALAVNGCQFVYCGLESLSERSLQSVAKGHNRVADYRRIVGRAHAYGIEIASGFILGLEGTTPGDFDAFVDFAEEVGILYLKLTYLTFNPGTRVRQAMEGQGRFLTDAVEDFDGNSLTFLPKGLEASVVEDGAQRMLERFYSVGSAWRRSRHLSANPARRGEFLLLSSLFGRFYDSWISGGLPCVARKSWGMRGGERLLTTLRGMRIARV